MAYALEDEFGDIIGKAKRGQGISPSQVAAQADITEAQLAQMENYTRKPTETQVYKIAAALNLDGPKLLDIAMERWAPAPIESGYDDALDTVTVTALVGGWPVNAYLLVCKETNEAAIIDTAAHPQMILEKVKEIGVTPTIILLTHAHGDHANGLLELEKATGCPTYIHADEPKPRSSQQFNLLKHGDEVSVGKLAVKALDTPGHTPGGCSFFTRSTAFVGDAIFAGSVGGPNISYEAELTSVQDNLLSLPDDVKLFPGHGPATTVGEEKAHNPFFWV
jgi:glyoxylase-like metal-dependent hydrolase (beta-lactamase superfamily II)